MDLNKAMIIGNLTRDPEVKTTPAGVTVASFGIATNRVWKDQAGQQQKSVEFHNIVVWRRLAEICGQYLRKGSKAYFEGRLQTSTWTDPQTNTQRYKTEIVVDNMIMLSGASNANPQAPSSQPTQFQPNEPTSEPIINVEEPMGLTNEENNSEEDIKVEKIPF